MNFMLPVKQEHSLSYIFYFYISIHPVKGGMLLLLRWEFSQSMNFL